jgi:hypothetical protein
MAKLYIEDLQDLDELDVAAFPVVEDLVVGFVDAGSFGQHVELSSGARGKLAEFPYLDHAYSRLTKPNFEIPLGTAASPFEDLEQGWQIVIWEAGGWVMVVEADDIGSLYDRGFRVDAGLYRRAWRRAISEARERNSAPTADR